MELKVGDFGLATKLEFEGERKRTVCGTPNYIAPEILDGKCGHSYEVDIWSLGVIIYTLIIGKPPFETQDVKTTYKRIKMNSYSFPEKAVISDAAKTLIQDILTTDPMRRPNLDGLIASDFFALGTSIPRLLPTSTLACPPSLSYIRQFMPEAGSNGIVQRQGTGTQRMGETKDSLSNKMGSERDKNKQPFISNQLITNSARPDTVENTGTGRPLTSNYMSNNIGNLQGNTLKDSTKNLLNTGGNTITSEKRGKTSSGAYGTGSTNPSTTSTNLTSTDIWVKKWVDYSSKYGLGYLLSNGFTGVFFNDSSKIILDPKTNNFNYIERRMSDKQEIANSHTLSDYPKELQKKVTLLQHFRSYLEGDINNAGGLTTSGDIKNFEKVVSTNLNYEEIKMEEDAIKKINNYVYVKKLMKTRDPIMFRLSNRIVQVCFQDHTEIILSSVYRIITYVNKKAERLTYQLDSALESNNTEMTKRLKYTKDILTHMLTLNQGASSGVGSSVGVKDAKQIDPTADEK